MEDEGQNLHVCVIFRVLPKSVGEIFLYQKSFILSAAADISEYLEEEEEERSAGRLHL